jgi:polyadenylate-binding protein
MNLKKNKKKNDIKNEYYSYIEEFNKESIDESNEQINTEHTIEEEQQDEQKQQNQQDEEVTTDPTENENQENSSKISVPSGLPGQKSLYVGNLNFRINDSILFDFFKDFKPTFAKVCKDMNTQKSLGYGYVNFRNSEDAKAAMENLSYSEFYDQPVRIMWSQRDPSLRKTGLGNLYIKNLDPEIEELSLYGLFSSFGNILSCKVSKTKIIKSDGTSEISGYGFVHFQEEEEANSAMEKLNGLLINNRKVIIEPYIVKSERPKPNSTLTNIYVNNFPKDLSKFNEENLKKMFSKFGEINSLIICKESNGQSKGFGFIDFANEESAKKAIDELNNTELEGQKILVTKALKKR